MTRLEIVFPVAPTCSLVVAPFLSGQCLVTPIRYSMITEKSGLGINDVFGHRESYNVCDLA
jgi:hypothetical protein